MPSDAVMASDPQAAASDALFSRSGRSYRVQVTRRTRQAADPAYHLALGVGGLT